MYIDNIVRGVNPLKPLLAEVKGSGPIGQLASRYQHEDEYAELRKNPEFIATLTALQNADVAMLAAGKLIKEEKGRLVVGRTGQPGGFDRLDADETTFIRHLAQARVELTQAERKCREATVEEQLFTRRQLIDSIAGKLIDLNYNLKAIHPNALVKVVRLAAEMEADRTTATATTKAAATGGASRGKTRNGGV